jgi:adenylosuccinate synthase
MPATVIVGGQWGDEGKAKVVDFLMHDHDVVVRFQGGANAGHTVVSADGRFAFHQIPSGVLYPSVTAVLANGMVIDPFAFLGELRELVARGVDMTGRLFVSSAAQVVMPYHRVLDNLIESDLKKECVGSTGRGIGPAYGDKHLRGGLRMGMFLLEKSDLFDLVKRRVGSANRMLAAYGGPPLSAEKVAGDFVNVRDDVFPFVVDTQQLIHDLKARGKRILLEGAQGTLLDIDHGTYPFVTSSSCTVGGALTGTGLVPQDVGRVIGIFKAYVTRVGNGPMPSEIAGSEGNELRERGSEYGTTTGRPRRCGWFDLVAGRYSVMLNGFSEIALTKLDVVSGLPAVKLCVAYEAAGSRVEAFPQGYDALAGCSPVFEEMPGWSAAEARVSRYEDLPEAARRFIERLERELGVRVAFISTGPARDETIIRDAGYSFDEK